MTGPEAARLFKGLSAVVQARTELSEVELLDLVRASIGMARSPAAVRSKRYRDAKRHIGVTNVTPKRDERHAPAVTNVTARHAAPPPSLGFPLASPSGSLPPAPAKEIAVASEGTDRFSARTTPAATTATRPRNHAEALTEPAAYIAELCRDDATYASFVEAHRFPWVVEPIQAWHEAGGDTRPLSLESSDGEVRAMLALTARGYVKSDLVRVARYLRTTEKYRDKVLASSMTKAVVDIALAELQERPQQSRFASDLVRRVEANAGPVALGAALPKLAVGGRE